MSVRVSPTVSFASFPPPFAAKAPSVSFVEDATPSPTESMSFQSCVQDGYAQSAMESELVEMPLRVRNENVQPQPASLRELEAAKPASTSLHYGEAPSRRPSVRSNLSNMSKAPPRRSSIRSIRTVLTFWETSSTAENGATSRLPVPPPDDPVIARAVETSLDLAKEHVHPAFHHSKPESDTGGPTNAFRRWVSGIHKRKLSRVQALKPGKERWSLDDFDDSATMKRNGLRHKKSESWPSSAFVTAVRSAKMSFSILEEPSIRAKINGPPPALGKYGRGRRSYSFGRNSIESNALSIQSFDEVSRARALNRRNLLEELVKSEEQYVADLKMLVNVYQTLRSTAHFHMKSKIQYAYKNVAEILALHERLLGKIQPFVNSSSIRRLDAVVPSRRRRLFGHGRSQSTDSGMRAKRNSTIPIISFVDDTQSKKDPGIPADGLALIEVAGVAAVFRQSMSDFFVYEEYAAQYHSMLHDMTFVAKAVPNWEAYERGLEALANTLVPNSHRDGLAQGRNSLTLGDLLMKPMQRVARYPLLFSELVKSTPVIDSPEVHGDVEKALYRLRETAAEIDRATQDEYTKDRIQRSWRLQDMLAFSDLITAPFMLRSLGHPNLCGVLHFAYRNNKTVVGEYMLCALFKSCLVLGFAPKASDIDRRFRVAVSISLMDLRIEASDNGKGLQCYTAPFSWKILFESDHQLFELLCSAASPDEERQWRLNLTDFSAKASLSFSNGQPLAPECYSHLYMDLKPAGYALGQPGTLARRLSVQRPSTIGPRANLFQVIIRDTTAPKTESEPAGITTRFGRSRSLLSTTGRIPVLCPRRSDRIRIEQDMANFWTKETLPYPVMKLNQKEHNIRASASSVMRKLSRSSIASSISKRTSHRSTPMIESSEEVAESAAEQEDRDGAVTPMEEAYIPPRPASRAQFSIMTQIHSRRSKRSPSRACAEIEGGRMDFGGQQEEDHNERSTEQHDKTIKSRWSSPAALLGSFSADGFRGLFNQRETA